MKYVLAVHSKDISDSPIIRVHSSCLLSETLGSTHCDCADQLHESLNIISQVGGIVFYLDQEGRGHGLLDKVVELELQQTEGLDTVEASEALNLAVDERRFDAIADILKEMGIDEVRILTNNPRKINQLKADGIEVIERVPLEILPNEDNRFYLSTKRSKLGHLLNKHFKDPHVSHVSQEDSHSNLETDSSKI